MSDLISRQAAIDAVLWGITHAKAINKDTGEVIELFRQGNEELTKAADRIKDLPSAQPNTTGTTTATTTDCISRQDAIDAMRQYAYYDDHDVSVVDEDVAVIALKDLPSVQERKGRWNRVGDIDWECTACGGFSCCNGAYCPDCGAKMEGAEDAGRNE